MCKYFAVVLFLQSLTPLFSRIIEFLSTFTFVECQLGQRTDTKKIAASNYICSPLNQYEYISSFQINTIKRHRRSFKLIRNKLNLNIQKPLDVLTSQKNICNHKLILSAWKIYWDIYCFKGFIYRTQSWLLQKRVNNLWELNIIWDASRMFVWPFRLSIVCSEGSPSQSSW